MIDSTVMHRRAHVWPSRAFVLGLALAAGKAFGAASAAHSTIRTPGRRHMTVESII
ncbi:MAG TPA: hypothetical protein VGG08_08595 [Solirubrobacteraceae bacterium]|jgi:hypothetical protein